MDYKKLSREEELELGQRYHQEAMKNWRAWGSWFSWGSPVGLGLFFISLGATTVLFVWATHLAD